MNLTQKVTDFVANAIDTADYCIEKHMKFSEASGWIYNAMYMANTFCNEICACNRRDILENALDIFAKAFRTYPRIENAYEETVETIKTTLAKI